MATKKEMVAELVSLGKEEAEIKDLKNSELEAMLAETKATVETEELVEVGEGVVEEVVTKVAEPEQEAEKEAETEEAVEVEVVRETVQQLGIFRDYIYNKKNKDAKLVVENLGLGDVYVDEYSLAIVGESKRLTFGQTAEFTGVDRLQFISASQPVVQILEVK